MYKLTDDKAAELASNASRLLFEHCKKNDIHYVVTGSSGGLDSAITLMLAKMSCEIAAENNYNLISVGAVLPCGSSITSVINSKLIIEKANAKLINSNLSIIYRMFGFLNNGDLGLDEQIAKIKQNADFMKSFMIDADLKSSMRSFYLNKIAVKLDGLLLSTSNFTKSNLGLWSLRHRVGDFGMTQNLLRGLELPELARYLKIPNSIINSLSSDGLTDPEIPYERQFGLSYSDIDQVFIQVERNNFDSFFVTETNSQKVDNIIELYKKNKDKHISNSKIFLTRQELGLPEIKDIDLS